MTALVVVESAFGNTREIADAVAEGLGTRMPVRTVDAAEDPGVPAEVDLLVVGGPTHAFGMSRPATRTSAAEQGGRPAPRTGLREWLEALPRRAGAGAAFDTRTDRPRVPGSAARAAARRLRRRGRHLLLPAETFRVTGTSGPLLAGERERAREWGAALAARYADAGRAAGPGVGP